MLGRRAPRDLRAARDVGLKTAYVTRPLEYGPNQRASQDR